MAHFPDVIAYFCQMAHYKIENVKKQNQKKKPTKNPKKSLYGFSFCFWQVELHIQQ